MYSHLKSVASSDCKTGSDKASSYLSSSCSTPPPQPSLDVKPFTEQEISVYKKLCQDLERLVQLTKAADDVTPTSPITPQLPAARASPTLTADVPVPTPVDVPPSDEPAKPLDTEASAESSSVDELIVIDDAEIEWKVNELIEPSPVKRDVSASLKESTTRSVSSCSSDKPEAAQTAATKEEATRSCKPDDAAAVASRDEFFRGVQLAKLSGDWKESTPSVGHQQVTAVVRQPLVSDRRRTSLLGVNEPGNNGHHWEGELRSREQRLGIACNASHAMSRLTANYICYITNHLTAQFCLLLVFFLVLLLAIVTVP